MVCVHLRPGNATARSATSSYVMVIQQEWRRLHPLLFILEDIFVPSIVDGTQSTCVLREAITAKSQRAAIKVSGRKFENINPIIQIAKGHCTLSVC